MLRTSLKNLILGGLLTLAFAQLPTAKADHEVPIQTRTAGHYTLRQYLMAPIPGPLPFPLNTTFVHMEAVGVGVSSHMGKYTIEIEQGVQIQIVNGLPTYVAEGTYVATAANGDQIFGTFTNYRVIGQNLFTGVAAATGGTGRFEGVTGEETTVGEVFPDLSPAGLDSFYYEHGGFITSVGSNRRNK
jgi:hypothetical protein